MEFELSNGKVMTFSNTLVNADGTYFWFSSEQDGLSRVRQDKVISIGCCDKPHCNSAQCDKAYYNFHGRKISKDEFYIMWMESVVILGLNLSNAFENACKTFDVYFSANTFNYCCEQVKVSDLKRVCGYYFRQFSLKQYSDRNHYEN